MDKTKVKAPILLRIALAFFTLLFILSTSALFYFRFYLVSDVQLPSYISILADSMRGGLGFVYYVLIPLLVVLGVTFWYLIAKGIRKERLLFELEHTVPEEDDDTMRVVPFQDSVAKSTLCGVNSEIASEVTTQTVKSPIVPTKQSKCVHEAGECETSCEKTDMSLQFAPNYVLQNDISSISELKAMIAKSKSPEISICPNDDLSNLSEKDKEQLQKMNSLDRDKIFNQIKQHNELLDTKEKVLPVVPKHTYKVIYKQINSPEPMPKPEPKKQPEKVELHYLTADEIVLLHRKEKEDKIKQTLESVDSYDNEIKTLNDIAKFYYESDLEEYTIEE